MSVFDRFDITLLVVAVLVKRLGGDVVLTQADIDDVAYHRLDEEYNDSTGVRFTLVKREQNAL